MDRLRNARRPLRGLISKYYNEIMQILESENSDETTVQVKFEGLTENFGKVDELDQKILDLMIDENLGEEAIDAEFISIEEYKTKYRTAKFKVDKFLSSHDDAMSVNSLRSVDNAGVTTTKYPKIQLCKFDGDLKELLGFWAQFRHIDEDKQISVADKFQYLVQSMVKGSKAYLVVSSYPQSEDNYPKAMEALKRRFGKDDLLVEVYVRELLKLVLNKHIRDAQSLSKMYDTLESHLRALESLGVISDKYAAMLYPLVESSLPEEILRAWQRNAVSSTVNVVANSASSNMETNKSRLALLMQFLQSEVEGEERINLVKNGFEAPCKRNEKGKRVDEVHEKRHTASGLHVGEGNIVKFKCIFCSGGYENDRCVKAQSYSQEEKRKRIQENKCCYVCLKGSHIARNCKVTVKCPICGKRHYALLCSQLKITGKEQRISKSSNEMPEVSCVSTEGVNTNISISQVVDGQVMLQTIVVKTTGASGSKVLGLLFDSGAQRSYIKGDSANAVGAYKVAKLKGHYLAHRPVFKSESSTTPIRPVFDASSKSLHTLSLNHCLEKGPNLLALIPSVILKFREKKIRVTADIKKVFMISVHPEDRNFLRFLWWDPENTEIIKVYRHKRVVFGVNCSPYLLAAVIDYHLDRAQESLKDCADILRHSLYVGNRVTSVDDLTQFENFRISATALLDSAKMDLRLWERSTTDNDGSSCSDTGETETKVLGIKWDKCTDTVACVIPEFEMEEAITKRKMLSILQKIYDPLGFLTPAMLVPKLCMQDAWVAKLGWDDKLPGEIETKFRIWVSEFHLLSSVRVHRWISSGSPMSTWSLHVFCDASERAYAAFVFLRSKRGSEYIVLLLQSKSRVAPLKRISIPRLELLACVIGTRLLNSVKVALNLKDIVTYFWTDSTTAVAWIQGNSNWAVFVKNRVNEIRASSEPTNWRHISGKVNPADILSRGCAPSKLLQSQWWKGSTWLSLSEEFWPVENPEVDLELIPLHERLVGELSADEINKDEELLIKLIQKECFSKDKRPGPDLRVITDEKGLLKVATKITRSDDVFDFKYPYLLPSSHPVVDALIRYVNERNCHAGVQATMAEIRRRFLDSQIFEKDKFNTLPTPLPADRVGDTVVFNTVGVDLAGPLYLRDGSKVWVVLFTCAVYRAVHLELTASLSTEGFLQALRRFIARGSRVLYSDNGRNFMGAENLFRALDWKYITAVYATKRIQWKFNPPDAPWWGGWWERLVQMMKKLLLRVLGKLLLYYEELLTILCDVESVINNRPLTYVLEDSDDLIPLTPSMFLQEISNNDSGDLDHIESSGFEKRLRYKQRLRQDLRARFRKEYFSLLVQKTQEKQIVAPQIGDVVLIGSDNKKRLEWLMRSILELYPGPDGHTRVVKIKTTKGEIIRFVQKLYLLEVGNREEVVSITNKPQNISTNKKELIKVERESVDNIQRATRSGRVVRMPKRYK